MSTHNVPLQAIGYTQKADQENDNVSSQSFDSQLRYNSRSGFVGDENGTRPFDEGELDEVRVFETVRRVWLTSTFSSHSPFDVRWS